MLRLAMSVLKDIQRFGPNMSTWRRQLHATPELGHKEHETSRLVATVLASYGYEVHTAIGTTGVVGRMRAGSGSGSVGLRADMDALPIHENNEFEHKSRREGVMHACGHDGHTAMLLGAAAYLAEARNFDGTVNLIFQPGEEGLGGACAMLEAGLFDRFPCDAVYAMHNKPGLQAGEFAVFHGPMLAGCAFFSIKVIGRSCHAARPESGVDPVVIAAEIVTTIQTIVSRHFDPRSAAVVSVTRIQGGNALNVTPEFLELEGTARCLSMDEMNKIEERLKLVANGICTAHGARCEVSFKQAVSPLSNDPEEARLVHAVCEYVSGQVAVNTSLPVSMASDDFAEFLRVVPGCYLLIGNGELDQDGGSNLHTATYDFNDKILPVGAAFFVEIALRRLQQ
jgi:hippurate hydrolase